MKRQTTQYVLWALTMVVLISLAIDGQFDTLILAILISALVWSAVVPHPTSR